MKYIVIRAKDDDDKQDILRRLSGGRHLEWTELSDPRESADNQISLIMADGVSFTLSCNPNQSTTNDNSSSRTADNNLPSTSSGLQGVGILSDRSNHHQSNPPVRTESNGYDAPQYPYSQLLNHGYKGYTNYQPHPLAMNELNGYDAQQYDYSQSSAHSYEGYAAKDMNIENENDGLSVEPSTSTAPKRPMDDEYSEENDDYTYHAKKPRNGREKETLKNLQCGKCSKTLSSRRFRNAESHAATHPDSRSNGRKFKCPVEGCNFKHCWKWCVKKHFDEKHNDFLHLEKIEITSDEKEEWVQHVNDCFPEINNRKEHFKIKMCKKCNMLIFQARLILRDHVLNNHIKHFVYKCDHPKCDFDSNHRWGVKRHKITHGKEVTEVKLTDDQEKEVADMIKKCFPDE